MTFTCHLRLLCYQSPNDGGNLSCCYFVHAGGANAQSVTDMIFSMLNEILENYFRYNFQVVSNNIILVVKQNFLTGLSPTESRLQNKSGSFSAIMWDIWTTLDTQFQKQIIIMAECAKNTYAFYTIHDGGRNIDFRQMSISLGQSGQTTANNCKIVFTLHVVESASDDYNF